MVLLIAKAATLAVFCSFLPAVLRIHGGSSQPCHLPFPAVAFSVERLANWVNFCDLADVQWELRSVQAHFYVCPKPRFQLGERLWNLFPKVPPKLCSFLLQLPP